jgi:hypothetical protein
LKSAAEVRGGHVVHDDSHYRRRNGRFNSSCFGLALGPFAHRCSAFNGTLWIVGGTWTSTFKTVVGPNVSTHG